MCMDENLIELFQAWQQGLYFLTQTIKAYAFLFFFKITLTFQSIVSLYIYLYSWIGDHTFMK